MNTYLLLGKAIIIFAFGIKIAYNIHRDRDQLFEILFYEMFFALFALLLRVGHNPFINIFLAFSATAMLLNYAIFFYFRKQKLTF